MKVYNNASIELLLIFLYQNICLSKASNFLLLSINITIFFGCSRNICLLFKTVWVTQNYFMHLYFGQNLYLGSYGRPPYVIVILYILDKEKIEARVRRALHSVEFGRALVFLSTYKGRRDNAVIRGKEDLFLFCQN